MSRRYGRNQKRAHREEIARLQAAHNISAGICAHITRKLDDANTTIKEMIKTVEAVCQHSIAKPPETVCDSGERDRYQVANPLPYQPGYMPDSGPVINDIYSSHVDLYALRLFLESNREKFQTAVHLEYVAGRHSVYMISEAGLRSLPENVLLRRIVPDIGRALVNHLRGGA